MKFLVDFWKFPSIYDDLRNMITKLFLFWFSMKIFHICGEQFYDGNKQELVKMGEKTINQQTMPCQTMAQVLK